MFVQAIIEPLPAHNDRLNKYRQNKATDTVCSQLIIFANLAGQLKSQND